MAIVIQSKYQNRDKVVVAIYEDTQKPYLRYETEIAGQLESLTDDALIQYALDDFYERYLHNKAENERYLEIKEEMKQVQEATKRIADLDWSDYITLDNLDEALKQVAEMLALEDEQIREAVVALTARVQALEQK